MVGLTCTGDGISDYICILANTHVLVGINAGSEDNTHPVFGGMQDHTPDHRFTQYTGSQVRIAQVSTGDAMFLKIVRLITFAAILMGTAVPVHTFVYTGIDSRSVH